MALRGRPLKLILSTLKLTCAIHLLQTHIVQIAPASGPSMLPTFTVAGEYVLTDATHARNRRSQLRPGDLVTYRIPVFRHDLGMKRLVGLEGDYVSIGTVGEKGEDMMIQIPPGHCWVTGENLPASRDSRMFGPLPIALIQGKVIARVLPWSERGWLRNTMDPIDRPYGS